MLAPEILKNQNAPCLKIYGTQLNIEFVVPPIDPVKPSTRKNIMFTAASPLMTCKESKHSLFWMGVCWVLTFFHTGLQGDNFSVGILIIRLLKRLSPAIMSQRRIVVSLYV